MYVQIPYFFDLFKSRLTFSEDSLQDKRIHLYSLSPFRANVARGGNEHRWWKIIPFTTCRTITFPMKIREKHGAHIQIFRPSPVFATRRTYSRYGSRRADPHTGFYPVNVRGRVRVSVLPHNLHIVARQKPPARGHFSPTAQPADFFPREYITSRGKVFVFAVFSFVPSHRYTERQASLVRSPPSSDPRTLILRIYSHA